MWRRGIACPVICDNKPSRDAEMYPHQRGEGRVCASGNTRIHLHCTHNVCGNVLVFPSSSFLKPFSFSISAVPPLLTIFIPLISPRLCKPEHMSLVHHPRQSAIANVVLLPVHRGLHTHATPSNQRLTPASLHSVASSTRQKRSFFGVGEILHVVVNVCTSFSLASIARLMPS